MFYITELKCREKEYKLYLKDYKKYLNQLRKKRREFLAGEEDNKLNITEIEEQIKDVKFKIKELNDNLKSNYEEIEIEEANLSKQAAKARALIIEAQVKKAEIKLMEK